MEDTRIKKCEYCGRICYEYGIVMVKDLRQMM